MKYSPTQIDATLNQFANMSYNKYGNHSHAAGYMQSMLVKLIADLPKYKQAELLKQILSSNVFPTLEA